MMIYAHGQKSPPPPNAGKMVIPFMFVIGVPGSLRDTDFCMAIVPC